MSAKRTAQALLELDTGLADFAASLEGDAYDPNKGFKVLTYVHENVMGTWTLTLAARSAGKTEEQVVGALLCLPPLCAWSQPLAHGMGRRLFSDPDFLNAVAASQVK